MWDECITKTENIFFLPLSEFKRQIKPQQSANANSTSAPRRYNEVDSLVKSSKLSASAPEFVPSGISTYEVRGIFTPSLPVSSLSYLLLSIF